MALLDISKPFESYVSVEELPRTGDARKFLLRLLFEVEGTLETRELTWPWSYSGTQEAIDQKHGADGLRERRMHEIDMFRRHVEYELGVQKRRLYEVEGRETLMWGKKS
jgi:hypothetical protein